MSAGNATPSDARMMWKPSVNAIWLRAASSCDAAEAAATSGPGINTNRSSIPPWRGASSRRDERPGVSGLADRQVEFVRWNGAVGDQETDEHAGAPCERRVQFDDRKSLHRDDLCERLVKPRPHVVVDAERREDTREALGSRGVIAEAAERKQVLRSLAALLERLGRDLQHGAGYLPSQCQA